MSPDVINGLFEIFAGLFLLLNIYKAYKDKSVKGVSVLSASFFMAWGFWNLYFYPTLDCWWSFYGGILVVVNNSVWVMQMLYYKYVGGENYIMWDLQDDEQLTDLTFPTKKSCERHIYYETHPDTQCLIEARKIK